MTVSVPRRRTAHPLRDQTRYHAQTRTNPTTTSIMPLYATNGPSIVSHIPPSPMIDKPMGRTQQDALSKASRPATPTIPKAGRTASGRRMYSDTEVLQLRFIKRCRDLGFPIKDAVALRDLSTAQPDACQAVEAMANEHLQDVQSRMVELQRLELALQEIVANCSQGNQSCPMLVELMTSDD